jgi:hypothetical protein
MAVLAYQMPNGGTGLPSVEHTPLPTVPQLSRWLVQSKRLFPEYRKEPFFGSKLVEYLVCAAREQGNQHHQVRQGKQPLVRLLACRFRGPRDKAQVTAFRKIANVIDANPGQTGNLRVGKNLLA